MATALKIGALAKATRTTTPTIRYYEDIGLLPAPPRPPGRQRVYEDTDVRRLTFIRRCRDFGFSIEKVRRLVTLMQDRERSCMETRDLAFSHLAEIREKLAELHELERSIAAFVDACDRRCPGGTSADCVILEELAEGGANDRCCGRGILVGTRK
jgi:DNA-binding transcriptional MerR regulator